MPTCYYRSGFDIAMPLRSKKTFPMLSAIAPWNREFFLTVKVCMRSTPCFTLSKCQV